MSRGPFAQQRYRPEDDCGRQSHTWHVPLRWWETKTYCSHCGKVRRKMKPRKPKTRQKRASGA